MTGRGKRKPKSVQDSTNGNKKQHIEVSVASPLTGVTAKQRDEVERLYKLKMPEDFYHFWDFCMELCSEDPRGALKEALGLQLVGPFDILAGAQKQSNNPQPNFNLHWRYFYDPPEFQTIIIGQEDSRHHIGYYRDTPDSLPSFTAENEAKKGYAITQIGENVFAAVYLFLLKKKKNRKAGGEDIDGVEEKLKAKAEELNLSLELKTKAMKMRDKKVVTKTFHGAGIVVPVDKNDVGYRELPETDADMKKICKAIAEAKSDEDRIKAFGPLQQIITFVQFANDECDYGMGYELGMDLFCFGSHYFHKTVKQLLPMAYNLLKRDVFGEILEDHLTSRSHENLDQLSGR